MSILLVDDEPGVLFTLSEVLTDRGHKVVTAKSGAEALTKLDDVDAVLTDLSMPGMDGLELMAQIVQRDASLPVVLLTAHGSERVAVLAMKQGAYHYLAKPFDIDEVAAVLDRALEARRLRIDNRRLAAEQTLGRRIIGASRAMRRLLEATSRVATRDVTVLVRGETGTGKEFVAELLHAQSLRASKPLVRFNCAALPAELADAELFGHVKGAFTGATATRPGFFAQADGGTLILDEIGELPLAVQAKLLRVLQEGEIQPVGSGRIEKVNVRVVASTNRDLAAEAKAGTFREDLYYRLAVVELVVPPLRDRKDDIPALAAEFARRYGERQEWRVIGDADHPQAVPPEVQVLDPRGERGGHCWRGLGHEPVAVCREGFGERGQLAVRADVGGEQQRHDANERGPPAQHDRAHRLRPVHPVFRHRLRPTARARRLRAAHVIQGAPGVLQGGPPLGAAQHLDVHRPRSGPGHRAARRGARRQGAKRRQGRMPGGGGHLLFRSVGRRALLLEGRRTHPSPSLQAMTRIASHRRGERARA